MKNWRLSEKKNKKTTWFVPPQNKNQTRTVGLFRRGSLIKALLSDICSQCFSLKVLESTDFWTFIDYFIVAFGLNQLKKKSLMGKVADWVKKKEKHLLNCKYKVTFQPNGCAKPTCTTTCFIYCVFDHCQDNIWLLKSMFVGFYLFVYLLFWG